MKITRIIFIIAGTAITTGFAYGSQATTTGDVACAIASGAAVACGKAAFSAYAAAGTMLAATPAGWAIGAVVLVG